MTKKRKQKTKFGFCAPIFANPGMLFFRTPAYKKLDWKTLEKMTIRCEKLGYDSVFVADHLFLGKNGEIWECLATMSALAAITKRMEIVPIHLCNNFRSPGVTAKALATISHISNGRVILFYDYGWRRTEFDSYGIPFGKTDDERAARMEEGLRVITGLLGKDNFSFRGKYYTVENTICTPKPVGKIPVWMGEVNNRRMVRAIVRHADVFNSMPCSPEILRDKLNIIKTECKKQKRAYRTLGISLETQVLIRKTQKEVEAALRAYRKLLRYNNSHDKDILAQLEATSTNETDFRSPQNIKKEFLVGTPEDIREKINAYKKCGVGHFMLWFMDYPGITSVELFAKEVAPYCR